MSIRWKVLVFILLAIVIVGGISTFFGRNIAMSAFEEEVANHMMTTVKSRSDFIESMLQLNITSVESTAQSISRMLTGDLAEMADQENGEEWSLIYSAVQVMTAVEDSILNTAIWDEDNKLITSTNDDHVSSFYSEMTDLLRKGIDQTYAGDIYLDYYTEEPVQIITTPIVNNGSQKGVLAVFFSARDIFTITEKTMGLGQTGEVYIINADGYMITPSRFSESAIFRQYIDHDTIKKTDDSSDYENTGIVNIHNNYQGSKVIGAHTVIPEVNWTVLAEKSVTEALHPVSTLTNILLLSLFAVMLAGTIFALVLSRRITRPILELHSGVDQLMAGNLDYRIGIQPKDEIGDLSVAFDNMAANLKQSREELEHNARELESRVEHRTKELEQVSEENQRAEENILRLNDDLERQVAKRSAELQVANMELESLTYSLAHNLSSAVTEVLGLNHKLKERYAEALDEKGKSYHERIYSGTQRMSKLIDDILHISYLTRITMRYETIDLSMTAESIAGKIREREPDRQVEFIIQPGISVDAHPQMIYELLESLLENAWKFTSKLEIARIEFGYTNIKGQTEYFVRDNGYGFDIAYADKLFRPFQRLHTQDEFEGTGIGLATVQRIVNRHGGEVWAEGEVDKGATFYFTLNQGGKY